MYKVMKNLLLLFILSAFGITAAQAASNDAENPLPEELKIEAEVANITVLGRSKWIDENTFRCKGRRGYCAIFGDEGGVIVLSVYSEDSDIPSYQSPIESYEMTETEEDGEPLTKVHFVPYYGEE